MEEFKYCQIISKPGKCLSLEKKKFLTEWIRGRSPEDEPVVGEEERPLGGQEGAEGGTPVFPPVRYKEGPEPQGGTHYTLAVYKAGLQNAGLK